MKYFLKFREDTGKSSHQTAHTLRVTGPPLSASGHTLACTSVTMSCLQVPAEVTGVTSGEREATSRAEVSAPKGLLAGSQLHSS